MMEPELTAVRQLTESLMLLSQCSWPWNVRTGWFFWRLSPPIGLIRISKFFENFALRTLNRNDYFALRTLCWEKSQCVTSGCSDFNMRKGKKNCEAFFDQKKSRRSNSHMALLGSQQSTGGWSHKPLSFQKCQWRVKMTIKVAISHPKKPFQFISKEKLSWHPNTNSLNFRIYLGTWGEYI